MAQKVVVYTFPQWGSCHRAKEFLSENGVEVEAKDAGNPKIFQEMVEKYQVRSVPIIVIGDEFVVGWGEEEQAKVKSLLNL